MARAKLTDQEKQEILRLFRETSIPNAKLADQFGVSASTISRLLKSELPEEELTKLSAARRPGRSSAGEFVETAETADLPLPSQLQPLDEAATVTATDGVPVEQEVPGAQPVQEVISLAPVEDVEAPDPATPETFSPEVVIQEEAQEALPAPEAQAAETSGAAPQAPDLPVLPAVEAETTTDPPSEIAPIAVAPVGEVAPEATPEELAPAALPPEEAVTLADTPDTSDTQPDTSRRRRRRSAGPPVPEVPPAAEPPTPIAPAPIVPIAPFNGSELAPEPQPPIVAPAAELPVEVSLPELAPIRLPVTLDDPPPVVPSPVDEPAPPQPRSNRILKKSDPARLNAPVPVSSQIDELEAEFAQAPSGLGGEEFDDDDDFEDEDEEILGDEFEPAPTHESSVPIEVLPFARAEFPRTCWVVVDRASELMTRPLREFGNIGAIPDAEREEITLPIFENHRIARRYSSHYHRPLRMPAHLLGSTRTYLLRKGITRLLVGKQVYSLVGPEPASIAAEFPEEHKP